MRLPTAPSWRLKMSDKSKRPYQIKRVLWGQDERGKREYYFALYRVLTKQVVTAARSRSPVPPKWIRARQAQLNGKAEEARIRALLQ